MTAFRIRFDGDRDRVTINNRLLQLINSIRRASLSGMFENKRVHVTEHVTEPNIAYFSDVVACQLAILEPF